MAYRTRRAPARRTRRAPARRSSYRSAAPRRSYRSRSGSGATRRASGSRARQQVVRIVVDHINQAAAAPAVAPDGALVVPVSQKRRRF